MFPKGTIRHPIEGDCPYVVVSRTEKGQVTSLPLKDIRISCAAPETAVTTSTYLPAENRAYNKSISVVSGETLKAAFERPARSDQPQAQSAAVRFGGLGRRYVLVAFDDSPLGLLSHADGSGLLPEARTKLTALSWEEIRLALMLDIGSN
jgi:hypothetical protein